MYKINRMVCGTRIIHRYVSLVFGSHPAAPTVFFVSLAHLHTSFYIHKEKAICPWVGVIMEGREIYLDVEDVLSWIISRAVLFSTEINESEIRLGFGNYNSPPSAENGYSLSWLPLWIFGASWSGWCGVHVTQPLSMVILSW